MNCEKCGSSMKKGEVLFVNGGFSTKNPLSVPKASFYVDKYCIDSVSLGRTAGWYCGKCGTFTASFNVRKQTAAMPIYDEGCDMEFDETVDELPDKCCPQCGSEIDIDYPKCPNCGYSFDDK